MEPRIKLFFNLIKQRLRPELDNVDLPESVDQETVEKLMSLAGMHSLTTIIGSALVEQNLIPEIELYKIIQKNTCRAAIQSDQLHLERQWLTQILEDAQIPYVPLKGAIIQAYYPESWMRESCDIDILIHEEDLEKAVSVLKANGCTEYGKKGAHDIPLLTPSHILLELHFSIRENIPSVDRVLDQVWEYSQPAPGGQYEYRQQNAFLLFHLIAHMAYHCIAGGCGIRSFVDIWLLRDKMEYDEAAFYHFLKEAKLDKFYRNVLHLIAVWFDGEQHTEATQRLEDVVVTGGAYGSADNQILLDQANNGGKGKRLLKRIFMPYAGLKTQYPVLEGRPWLMPVFQVARWLRLFTGGRLRRAALEYKTSSRHTDTQIDEAKLFLEEIGLDLKKS